MKLVRLLFSICLIVLPSISQAWWNDEWQYRKSIVLDTTAATGLDVKGNVSDAPVLIRLHTGNFGFFLDLKQDAGDLRFIADDDKTPLKHHVEKFDPINEMALVWVKVPAVNGAANTNKIWMYYGNPAASAGDDANGTFDVNQSLVLHFGEKDPVPRDATAYANNPVLSTVEYFPSSIIGSGARFNGDSIVKMNASPTLEINPQKGWSFTAWVKLSGAQKDAHIFHQVDGNNFLSVIVDGNGVHISGKSGPSNFKTNSANLTLGSWHNIAIAIENGKLSFYIDGQEQSSVAALFPSISGEMYLGAKADGSGSFTGEIDEVNVSSSARSLDYITLLAQSQAAQSNLVKLGEDEQKDAASESASYFGIILQNVTVDGWAVIILLVIMAVISWVVMFGKGMVLSKAQKDNNAFLKSFKEKASVDPAALDQEETETEKNLSSSPLAEAVFGKHDHFQSSPLYHIYHAGIQEVNSRLGRSVGAQASGLSLQSIESIRASLDASLVRENQRLNKQMVLLTIAISGGPFLGLLGTVVGVMITFAAIAAAGDVNVNAIAPGIAAALVATVAGLAVAIPALFGYNYFGSKIKEISADMHVFVDEFVTRVAEHYGRD